MDVKRIPAGKRSNPDQIELIDGIYRTGKDNEIWFVVQTNPQCENKVARGLVAKDVTHYVPRRKRAKPQSKRQKKLRKKKEPVSRPLLGRYVFAALPAGDLAFGDLRNVAGVQDFLYGGDGPLRVRAELVEEIARREEEGEFDHVAKRRRSRGGGEAVVPVWVKKGAGVIVDDGPFESFPGRIEAIHGDQRVKVAVNIFGRETPVELEIGQVRAA